MNIKLPQVVLGVLQKTLDDPDHIVSLHEPRLGGNEFRYVQKCLESTFVSSVGKFVDRFELELSEFTGAPYVVAVINGTAALHIALKLAGVQSGDEVLVPALTFVGTANAVSYCGGVPHFVDSHERTLGIDPEALRDYLLTCTQQRSGICVNTSTGRRIRALVPVHIFGHPCDLPGLVSVARDFGLELVEDAAESLGSYYRNQHTGTFGRLGILSFNGNKTITTGGGGAILANSPELARSAKHLTTTAKVPSRWEYVHNEIGYNYRLPNLNAALGCAQLEQLPTFLESKRRLFKRYQDAFAAVPYIRLFEEPESCQSNYWLQTLLLDEAAADQRDEILTATNDAGLMTRPSWTLLHRLAPFKDCPRMPLPVAELLERRIINIPSSAGLC